jgi:hypothetical protein
MAPKKRGGRRSIGVFSRSIPEPFNSSTGKMRGAVSGLGWSVDKRTCSNSPGRSGGS